MGTRRTNLVRVLLVALNCEAEFCRESFFLALIHVCQTARLGFFSFSERIPHACARVSSLYMV